MTVPSAAFALAAPVTPVIETAAGTALGSDAPHVGEQLKASTAVTSGTAWPDGMSVAYAWSADGTQFATGQSVTLASAQLGEAITVEETVSDPSGAYLTASATSAPTAAVEVTGAPGAPTGVTAGAQDTQAWVSWTPADDDGSPITGYTITATDTTT